MLYKKITHVVLGVALCVYKLQVLAVVDTLSTVERKSEVIVYYNTDWMEDEDVLDLAYKMSE